MFKKNKTDVTDEAIAAVFTWFTQHMDDSAEYSITYPTSEYELVMRRKPKLIELSDWLDEKVDDDG